LAVALHAAWQLQLLGFFKMPFLPVWDLNPLKWVKFQYVTVSFIALNAAVYLLLQSNLVFHVPPRFIAALALMPGDVLPLGALLQHLPELYRLITYMFLHANVLHLLFNMIFLFVFADNVEDAMGHVRFILFYLLCGIIAAFVHCVLTGTPDLPMIGASGAVSGVIGAYLLLHPNIRVWVLVPLPKLPVVPMRFSAGFVIGVWVFYQFGSAMLLPSSDTAWWAHIGGFLSGAFLVTLMKRREVHLFDAATGI
jgi:membrane associated rhomboid family serine protease